MVERQTSRWVVKCPIQRETTIRFISWELLHIHKRGKLYFPTEITFPRVLIVITVF